jgi:hypothetical protein
MGNNVSEDNKKGINKKDVIYIGIQGFCVYVWRRLWGGVCGVCVFELLTNDVGMQRTIHPLVRLSHPDI